MAKNKQKLVGQAPVIDGDGCFDELVVGQVELAMSRLQLTGHDLNAAVELVIGIMKNAGKQQKAYYRYAVLCGAYPDGVVVDGVTYKLNLSGQPTDIDYRRNMLLALMHTIPCAKENGHV